MDKNYIIDEVDNSEMIECLSISDSHGCLNLLNANSNDKKTLSILSMNIRSIHKNFDYFLVFMASLDISVDIFVLSECWTSELRPPPNINNFNMFWTRRSFNQNDGVVVYVKQDMKVSASEVFITEGNCLILTFSPEYSVICTYRPYCFSDPIPYIDSVDALLAKISTKNIIFTGDVNVDILPSTTKSSSEYYRNMMATNLMRQGITLPTHFKTCLDHMMIKSIYPWKTLVFEQKVTDHQPILLYVNNTKLIRTQTILHKTTFNYEKMKEDLQNETWDELYRIENDVNKAAELFASIITNIIEDNTQIKKIYNKYQPLKPWITKSVVKCIRKRDRLHQKAKAAIEDSTMQYKYTKYRNVCNKIIKYLKTEYYKDKLKINQGNIKETWKIIKEACNIKSSKGSSIDLLEIDNNPTTSLNNVNSYFTTIGEKLATTTLQKMKTTESELALLARTKNQPVKSMCLIPTDFVEIRNIILSLKSHSAPGWDKITSSFIKKYVDILAEPIAFICNTSFETGKFPDILKKAVVCPIFKSGDKKNPTNYRPISLLSTLSKILEKLVKKRVTKYLDNNNLLSENQYGFREGKSTEEAVLTLTNKITTYLDKGEKCIGIYLDLQKAFDTVSIPILLTRLENAGIRGLVLQWFTDYLSGRTQRVKIEGYESDSAHCLYGVPQGSTLGPTLFLIYINSLCDTNLTGLDLLMFADDTVLLVHEKSWPEVVKLAENCLSAVTIWLENNLLSLNASKTKYMCYSITEAGQPKLKVSVKIHTYPCNRNTQQGQCSCMELSRVNSIRYLGVYIDTKLNWKAHTGILVSRIRKLIYVFKALRSIANSELLLQTYRALCECVIRYCICAWGSAAKTNLLPAEVAQRAILKVLLYLPFRHPTTTLYEKAKVLSVRKLFIYESLRRYHRKTVPLLPVSNKRINRCPVPKARRRFSQKKYEGLVPLIYNKVDKEYNVKKYSNNEFKKVILKWLNKYNYEQLEGMLEYFFIE